MSWRAWIRIDELEPAASRGNVRAFQGTASTLFLVNRPRYERAGTTRARRFGRPLR